MAKTRAVWGVDVGHCALKALKLAINSENAVELVGHEYIEHAKILTQPDADPRELISKSLEKFLSRHDITEDRVAISVPGQHTLARFSKLPPVDPKKIPDIVQFEANQQIPFDMDEVIWDYQTFSQPDSPEVEVGIFAMKRDLIHEHLAHFSDVGIEPALMQSAPLAFFDAMFFNEQCSKETTVLVDIGAENTDLVITDTVRLWTRTIPIGGNNFTDALANGFKLSFSKAENLKRQATASKYARQIFQAMRPVFADMVGEIQRSIGFYTSTHREAKLDRLVGMGNAFKLPGLQKYLQQNLGLNVVRPTEFKNLQGAAGRPAEYQEQILSFGIACGLALQGLERGKITSNLLPPEIARQVIWRKKKPWFASAAACLLITAGLVWLRQTTDLGVLASNRGAGDTVTAMNLGAAVSLFKNPPSPDTPPREYAAKIKAMATILSQEYTKLKGLGKSETEECQDLLLLQSDKALWLRILQTIHDSIPQQPELASAAGGEEYVQAIVVQPDLLARPLRSEVFIEQLSSEFVDNVYAHDYRSADAAAEDPDPLFDYYTKDGVEGFVITLHCVTPNAEKGKFIEKQGGFIQTLKQNGQVKEAGFYFDGVRLLAGQQSTSAGPVSAPRGGPARPSGRPNPPAAGSTPTASPTASAGNLDTLTFEDRSDDWRFSIKFVVALENLPEAATPGSPKGGTPTKGEPKPKGDRGGR